MKTINIFFLILIIMGCNKEDNFTLEPKMDNSIQIREKHQSPQHNQTDFNFVLRAIHPSQKTLVRFGDGVRGARIQANIRVWKNGKVNGHISVKVESKSLDFYPESAIIRCDEGDLNVNIQARYRISERKRIISRGIASIDLQPTSDIDDNPECLIWDIKDSPGDDMANFILDGNIYFDHKHCRE